MQKRYMNFQYAAYRPNTAFYIRSVGDFRLINNEKVVEKHADFPEIFWCVEGCGSFELDGRNYLLRPNQVWYYPAGSVHKIQCSGELFHYRWIALDGPEASVLFDGLNLKAGINPAGQCPLHLFNKLALNIGKTSVEQQMENLSVGFQILLAAASVKHGSASNIEQMQQVKDIIDENFSNPDLNVESIAALMQMNRSVLSRMFSNTFKTTIVGYLAGRRLNEALKLLKETDLPINKIAELCGYSCHNYFTKVIRRHTGNSPNFFRKM